MSFETKNATSKGLFTPNDSVTVILIGGAFDIFDEQNGLPTHLPLQSNVCYGDSDGFDRCEQTIKENQIGLLLAFGTNMVKLQHFT